MPVHLLPGPFTVEMYHRLGELGIFDEDDRVELLDGQIVEMTPIGPSHSGCVGVLTGLLSRLVGQRAVVWVQNPLIVGRKWEPQPDLAVLRPRADSYRTAHPRAEDVLLVIEVADTSLERDRDVKVPRYAAGGIPEAWLVDLAGETIHVSAEPGPEGYRTVRQLGRGEVLRPVMLPGLEIRAEEVLG